MGFYLERFEAASGDYLRLNDHLLPGLLTSPEGGVYQYVDGSATPGETYRYRLVEVVTKGQENVYGPWTVSVVSEAPSPAARGLSKQARAELDNETLVSGYSRKPYGMTAARKARLEAMKAEQAAANRQGVLAQELRAKSQELTATGQPLSADSPTLTAAAAPTGRARITVRENGLYYLDKATIGSAFGMSPATVALYLKGNRFALTNGVCRWLTAWPAETRA